jgi:chemotaxis protein methyltransferase CheR
MTGLASLTDREFDLIRDFIHREAGIALGPSKKALVCGRLSRRVQLHGLASFRSYFEQLIDDRIPGESQVAVDLLTTNETYFFREPRQFEVLTGLIDGFPRARPLRIWSAACSSGEEVYTLAMVLEELHRVQRGPTWEITGSDISMRMLESARRGIYPEARTRLIPDEYRRRYCLRGTGAQAGNVMVDRSLRDRCRFEQVNLIDPQLMRGPYDIIFLRNVLIYFDAPTRRSVVERLLACLGPGGVLFVGLAESLASSGIPLITRGPGAYSAGERR